MENLCALFRFPGGDAALPRFQTGSRGRGMPTVHRPNHRSIAASPAGRPDIGFVTNVTAVFAAPAGRIPPYPLDGSDAGCWPIPPYPPGGGPNHTYPPSERNPGQGEGAKFAGLAVYGNKTIKTKNAPHTSGTHSCPRLAASRVPTWRAYSHTAYAPLGPGQGLASRGSLTADLPGREERRDAHTATHGHGRGRTTPERGSSGDSSGDGRISG
jgi:hypothetical protein